MQKRFLFLVLFPFFQSFLLAQNNYPIGYFRSPVDTVLTLVGNFGELRPNHLHAGFDIRTNSHEGMNIYAVADGYVSRIKISPYGYGNAIYITHPNGYTSVYGHLKKYADDIQLFMSKIQYENESFEADTNLLPGMFPVKKGQLIALSGNTGDSEGPHLHFEIRDSKSEMPVNPYYFGYVIADTVKPRITQLAIYPLGENATVNGKQFVKMIIPVYKKGNYSFLKTDTITVSGEIGFGIQCWDTETKSTNQNAVYSIELQSGGKRMYYMQMEKFSFENSRYVNAHIDYAEKQKHNAKIQKCFLVKNNRLEIYKGIANGGVINFTDDSIHWIRYILKDYAGNTTELMLKVKSRSHVLQDNLKKSTGDLVDCFKENKIETADIQLSIPAFALYEDVVFSYSMKPSVKGTYSPLHQVMNDETALQKSLSINIRSTNLPDLLQGKACIVSINNKGKRIYQGGNYKEGWVSTQTKDFGSFAIAVDTTSPKLKTIFAFVKNKSFQHLSKAKTIGVIATDNLSGIKRYRATVDGKWVLCEYDPKRNLLYYTFDDSTLTGIHTFLIEVSDDKNNTSSLNFSFKR